MQAESKVRNDHIGHWALWCSFASAVLSVTAFSLILVGFHFRNLPDTLGVLADMLGVVAAGSIYAFPAMILATVVLSIRALVLHRQSRWAVAALIVMFLGPTIDLGIWLALGWV